MTLMAALCWLRRREVTDSLVDLLIQVIHKINVRAEKRVEKEVLDDFKRVTGKITVLVHIAEASVEQPDGRVRDVVFPAAGGERKLHDLVREYKSSGPAFRFQVHLPARFVRLALPAHGAAPAAGPRVPLEQCHPPATDRSPRTSEAVRQQQPAPVPSA